MKALFTLATVTALTLQARADDDVRLRDCPQPVQSAIQQQAGDGKIDEIDTYLVDGQMVYVAEIDLADNLERKIYLSADGKLLKTREDILLANLPQAVRQTAETIADGTGKLDDLKKEIAGETATYHVEIDRRGEPDLDLVIAADGKLVSQTEDHDD